MNLQEFAKEILPVVQAAAEGKVIEHRYRDRKISKTGMWFEKGEPSFDSDKEYRIKPAPTHRPYTREEFIEKCLGKVLVHKNGGTHAVVCHVEGERWVELSRNWTMQGVLDNWSHLDGSPCGVEVQE